MIAMRKTLLETLFSEKIFTFTRIKVWQLRPSKGGLEKRLCNNQSQKENYIENERNLKIT